MKYSELQLTSIFLRIHDSMGKQALISALSFHTTSSLVEDVPQVVIYVERLDDPDLRIFVKNSDRLISLNAVSDVILMIDTLNAVNDIMHIDLFDSIHIYRGDVDLIRIIMKGRDMRRSVCVEVNEYHRRYANNRSYGEKKHRNVIADVILFGIAAVFVGLTAIKMSY